MVKYLKAITASLLIALAIVIGANPRNVYSQAQAVLFGSYMGAAKAVTVTTNGYLNVSVQGGGAGVVAPANGGTGISSYAVGDLLYASGATTLSKLADVAAGSYLRSGGVTTAPVWSTTTLPNSASVGDLMYASATNVYANLADVAVGSVLISGGVTTAPAWSSALGLGTCATTTSVIRIILCTATVGHSQVQFTSTGTAAGDYMDYIVKSGTTVANVGASNQNYGAGALGSGRSWLDTANITGAGWDYSAQGTNGTHCWFTTSSYTKRACLDVSGLAFANGGWLGFAAGTGASDAGIARTGAAAFAFGNGSNGDFTATLKATIANFVGSYQLNGVLMDSATAPTIASGGCTSPAVTHNNGTAAFLLTLGTSCTNVKTITLTMPAAAHFWAMDCNNNTSDAAQALMIVASRGMSTTAVVLTSYSRTTGLPLDYVASDTLLCKARAE